jgi:citrate lyase subunit beta/citryl-CoA lyase
MRKAPASGADVMVFDLEDAVAPDNRETAREAVREVFEDPDFDPAGEVCVRVNQDAVIADDDLAAVLGPEFPDAVMLPKATDRSAVETLSQLIMEHGDHRPVFALVETATGVLSAEEIASADATTALVFGAEDLAADLGATRETDADVLSYPRQRVAVAAAAAGIDAIDTVYTDIGDLTGLEDATRVAASLGYDGKLAIHPDQVEAIHAGFEPSASSLEWARDVLAAAGEHEGVFKLDGEMIDAPLVAQAERILERAGEREP